jgi:hypothetical protein
MPLTERLRQAGSLGVKGNVMPIAEKPERSERSALCVLRDICRSQQCQFANNGCPGSKKGN